MVRRKKKRTKLHGIFQPKHIKMGLKKSYFIKYNKFMLRVIQDGLVATPHGLGVYS